MDVDEAELASSDDVKMSLDCDNDLLSLEVPEDFDQISQTDAVYKFINGEITFNDYLNQVEKITDTEESQTSEKCEVVDPVSTKTELDISEEECSLSSSDNSEDETNIEPVRKTIMMKRSRNKSKLSVTLRGVMGQANLCYAKGDTETAVKMCLEIIKEEPKAPEPFKTLASIYEEMGEHEKSLQMRLIAAHLAPSNTGKDEWLELAQALKKFNHLKQAVICYTRAINYDVTNLDLYEERAALIKESGATPIEAYGFLRLLYKLNPETDGETLLYLCKKIARLYYNDKKFEKSSNTLKYAFEKCPNLITNAEVNLFLDVLITIRNFKECLEVMSNFCNVEFNMISNEQTVIESCTAPEDIPIDIRAKLIITLIHFDSFECAIKQIDILLKENPEVMGDLFFDVAMELIDKNQCKDAINLLEPLTETETFNSLALWFKLTHCYKEVGEVKKCHKCYNRALKHFPHDSDLKVKYCEELKNAGLYREAIEVTLNEDLSLLIYERCKLYWQLNDKDNFIESGLQLFRLHCKEIKTSDDYRLLNSVLHITKGFKELLSHHISVTVDKSVSVEEEWEIFIKICNLYIERKDYDLLQQLTMNLCVSYKFSAVREKLRFAVLVASYYNKDFETTFDMFRYLKLLELKSEKSWNFFNVVTRYTDYNRMHKFLIRYLMKHPEEDHALLLYANNCLSAGTYKYALNDYGLLFEKCETALLALLISITVLNSSCHKFSSNRHSLVTHMIAFMKKYEDLRGPRMKQEIFYNIGRAFHQIELLPQAMYYYKEALACKPFSEKHDLKMDIAFNLHLIYLNSGQPHIANMYLQKYVVI